MGDKPKLPKRHPSLSCALCHDDWDGDMHALPCGHKYHSRCCPPVAGACGRCNAPISPAAMARVEASAEAARDRRRRPSLNVDNAGWVRVARLPLDRPQPYLERMRLLLDAEIEQVADLSQPELM